MGFLISLFFFFHTAFAVNFSIDSGINSVLSIWKNYVIGKKKEIPKETSIVPKKVITTPIIITPKNAVIVPTPVSISDASLLASLRSLIFKGLPDDILNKLRGPAGATGAMGPVGPAGLNGASYTFSNNPAPLPNPSGPIGIMGGFANLGVQDLNTKLLTVTGDSTMAGALNVTGTITGNVTGTINPSFTLGSIAFQGTSGLTQDNANFFWDNTNKRLGIGTTGPVSKLHIGVAPTASTNYGTISLGSGLFDGTTSGYFVGSTLGTSFAINENSSYTGNLIDAQIGGVSKLKVDYLGNTNINTSGSVNAFTVARDSGEARLTIMSVNDQAVHNTADDYPFFQMIRNNYYGSAYRPIIVADLLGRIGIRGPKNSAGSYNGDGELGIDFFATENWTTDATGSRIAFHTTSLGTNSTYFPLDVNNDYNFHSAVTVVGNGTISDIFQVRTTAAGTVVFNVDKFGNVAVAQGTVGVGTVSTPGSSTTLTGVGTQFTNTFKVGDTLTVTGETVRTIATITSDTVLDVTVAFSATPRSAVIYTLTGGTRFSVLGNGNVGISCADPDNILEVGGTGTGCNTGTGSYFVAGGTTFTANSSREWKQNIATYDVPDILTKIQNTPARTFDWKTEYCTGENCNNNLGFIAQEFFDVLGRGDNLHVNGQDIMMAEWLGIQHLNLNLESIAEPIPIVDSFGEKFFTNLFTRLIAWFADSANGITKMFVKTIVTEGIQMKDSATAQIYCVTISNGNLDKREGECGAPASVQSFSSSPTIDVTPPIITLNEEATIEIVVGGVYEELGATAIDDVNGSVPVVISGGVDTSLVGIYTIHYNTTDSSNNPAIEVLRTVNVIE